MLTLGMDGKRLDCDDAGWESAPPPPKLNHFPPVVSDMNMQPYVGGGGVRDV